MSHPNARRIQLDGEDHHKLLKWLADPDSCALERRRITALLMSHAGNSITQIEKSGVLTRKSIGILLTRFEEMGLQAVQDWDRPGRASIVTEDIKRFIARKISDDTTAWNACTLSEAIQEEKGVEIQSWALIAQLKKMGLKWQRSRYVVSGKKDFEQYQDVKSATEVLKGGLRGAVQNLLSG